MRAPVAVSAMYRPPVELVGTPQGLTPLAGYCRPCAKTHQLNHDAVAGMAALQELFHSVQNDEDWDEFRTALDASRGKMLGVLVGTAANGQESVLYAFSGDLGGRAEWPRFVPPLLQRSATAELEARTLARIAMLEAQMVVATGVEMLRLRGKRREASRALMEAMHDAARVTNAGGLTRPLREVFALDGIPSGTGDCAIPKLLHAANTQGITPRAVAEAWWGPDTVGRRNGQLALPCARRCVPLLGWLLCTRMAS